VNRDTDTGVVCAALKGDRIFCEVTPTSDFRIEQLEVFFSAL
jgi:hypothetical protein